MPTGSELIIRTFLNSIHKITDDLTTLKTEEYIQLIKKLSITLDNLSDDLNTTATTTQSKDGATPHDLYSNPMFKMIFDQHDLLLRTLCSNYNQRGTQHDPTAKAKALSSISQIQSSAQSLVTNSIPIQPIMTSSPKKPSTSSTIKINPPAQIQ
ncbi:unnamed protein product [Didymodactylos carnosus]|uniref:Uncharacterized protein n=1 Tax=Didymodactylos carnosus TaxID=1234261 RepID=A0A814RYF9_9BILA|nr:unnamed protein product [Didymodactylos carnosus]CAF3903917.1 unnamed protein product [Didymodactylos carnosus]